MSRKGIAKAETNTIATVKVETTAERSDRSYAGADAVYGDSNCGRERDCCTDGCHRRERQYSSRSNEVRSRDRLCE